MTNGLETITLGKFPGLKDPDTEPLFDCEGRLIQSQCPELETEPTYEHPFRAFYEEYRQRLKLGRSVFTRYDETVPVSTSARALELFRHEHLEDRFPRFGVAGAREHYRLDPTNIKVGILTAGGNAPGLNTVIDSVVKRQSLLATARAAQPGGPTAALTIVGYRGGYEGLLAGERIDLNYAVSDAASLAPGSILKIRRGEKPTDEGGRRRLNSEMAAAVAKDQLDVLYVVGGDGTIRAAAGLCGELEARGVVGAHGQPVRVVAAPKTMDNDINFTDVTFGFRTTVENAVEAIRRIHVEAVAGERLGVIELFGAGSGFVALHAAYASGEVDYVLIPELMTGGKEQREAGLTQAAEQLAERYRKNRHAVLVVAEGATRLYVDAESKAPDAAFRTLVERLTAAGRFDKERVFVSQPAHLVRSTPPNAYDIDLCKQTGKLMVDTALAGFTRGVVSSWHGQFVMVPMETAVARLKQVDVGAYYLLSMTEKYLLPATSCFNPSGIAEEPLGIAEEFLG